MKTAFLVLTLRKNQSTELVWTTRGTGFASQYVTTNNRKTEETSRDIKLYFSGRKTWFTWLEEMKID